MFVFINGLKNCGEGEDNHVFFSISGNRYLALAPIPQKQPVEFQTAISITKKKKNIIIVSVELFDILCGGEEKEEGRGDHLRRNL